MFRAKDPVEPHRTVSQSLATDEFTHRRMIVQVFDGLTSRAESRDLWSRSGARRFRVSRVFWSCITSPKSLLFGIPVFRTGVETIRDPMKQRLTTLGIFAAVLLFLTPRLSAQAEPCVYRIRTADVQVVEEKLRARLGAEASSTLSIRPENESGTFRLCILASEQTLSQIPGLLQDCAELLPKEENAGLVRLNDPTKRPPFPTGPSVAPPTGSPSPPGPPAAQTKVPPRTPIPNPVLPPPTPRLSQEHNVSDPRAIAKIQAAKTQVDRQAEPATSVLLQPPIAIPPAAPALNHPQFQTPAPLPTAPNVQFGAVSPARTVVQPLPSLVAPNVVPTNVAPANLPPTNGVPTNALPPNSLAPNVSPPNIPLPYLVQGNTNSQPRFAAKTQAEQLPGAKHPLSADQARDSYTPTNIPFHRLEQTLCALLVRRLNEMSPGRFLLSAGREGGTRHCTLEFDRQSGRLLIIGERSLCDQVVKLVQAIDQPEPQQGRERRFVSIQNVEPNAVRKMLEINRKTSPTSEPSGTPRRLEQHRPDFQGNADPDLGRLERSEQLTPPHRLDSGRAKTAKLLNPKRNPVIQLVGYQFEGGALDTGGGAALDPGLDPSQTGAMGPGMEVVPDFRYQVLDDLDVVIIDATGAEVAKFVDMIRQIEELSKTAEPKIEVFYLKSVDCISLNWVIAEVYLDLFRTKQGIVKIMPLIRPNAMLLVGWGHSLQAMKDLIETLDRPVTAENNTLEVIRLTYASAQYMQTMLRGTFPPLTMGRGNGFAPRVQLYVDVRTNSLIVQAGPNDMKEIKEIVAKLDVHDGGPKLQVKKFKLNHTLATDLAQVLTDAITPATGGTSDRKLPSLELPIIDEKGERLIKSGIMADVRISRDVRTNTIIVTAPELCMPLLEEMIKMLDTPAATAEIKVFQIYYGDAGSMIKTLQSLIPSQLEGQVGPQLPGAKDEDALVPVRFAVDTRTNSILAAGAPNDLKIVEALLYSLDREDQQTRKETVYALKSMKAESVALAVNEYVRSKRLIQQSAPGVVSPFQQIESEVIIVPEAVSNSLIVSATPRYYDEILKLIEEIDKSPPQVVIQVLIGEVTLQNTDELGAEFGIQDSLLFNRSTFNSVTQGTRKVTRTENGVTTVLEEPIIINGTANPGWLFNNNPESSLGNGYNTGSAQDVGTVGSQLLTNFATGRVGAESGFGGMVFSANSDAVSIMIRALQETNRLEILSRPQITAMNNQKAFIHVGEKVPRVQGTTNTSYSESMNVKDEKVGLMLMVTPSISPEGKIVLLVAAEKSKVGTTTDGIPVGYSDGKEVRSPKISTIMAMTMISASDNETVVLGGLISKENQEINRKVPFLGDIPLVGKLFQYNFNRCKRSELLIIMTPRIIRSAGDMEEVKRIEAARMSWCLSGVARLHGDIGAYNVVGETPYMGDVLVENPEAIDMDGLQPIEKTPQKQTPTFAPPLPEPPSTPKVPVPTLPKQ